MNCPVCSTTLTGSRYCSTCGFSVGATQTAPTPTPTSPVAATEPVSAVPAAEGTRGRFRPGAIVASRYQVVQLLGRGGMGEVYHADDLVLNHPVALKLLPGELSHDIEALQRMRAEVRVARQVSHPNVCRVYDIGESDGLHFLSMEYIRGEDLRALLRRVRRLQPEKAVELAGQIAAGLAAAHDQRVLHRDLKPANIMIDERGHARIADFGLAAIAGSLRTGDYGAGTPAYMAPEQWAQQGVSERSDLYSLGLVLYELFTGARAFPVDRLSDLEKRSSPTPPSQLVTGLDPEIDRVILRCLARDPLDRPASAAAVAAAFPGGDPLAAAVERGETPAPGLVAGATVSTGLSPAAAWTCLGVVLGSLALAPWVVGRGKLSGMVPLPAGPAVLTADAREILARVGYPASPRDSTRGFFADRAAVDHMVAHTDMPLRAQLARGQPAAVRFWYRESPRPLVPHRLTEFLATPHDPPETLPGMVSLELDAQGRLLRLDAVPVPEESHAEEAPPDWEALLGAAGLDPGDLAEVEPGWAASAVGSSRAAWEGVYPDAPEVPIRVEAAWRGERAVGFRIVEPWAEAIDRERWVRPEDFVTHPWLRVLHVALHLAFIAALVLLAMINLRSGRGDRRVAFRLAAFFFTLTMLHWLFGAHHVADASQLQVFFGGLQRAFFWGAMAGLFYLALEPYARRLWPRALVTWVRFFHGRFRDPQVGRDVLFGCVFGTSMAVVFRGILGVTRWPSALPLRPDLPSYPAELAALRGASEALSSLFLIHVNILNHVLVLLGALLVLRFLLRRTWLAVAVHAALYLAIYTSMLGLLPTTLWVGIWYLLFFRVGFLPLAVASLTVDTLLQFPLATDLSAWYAHASLLATGYCLGLALYGFRVSLAGQPALAGLLNTE